VIAAAASVGACVSASPPQPFALRYADGEVADQQRELAERLAEAFVSVVILANVEADGEISSGVVSGASGTIVDPCGFVVTAAHIARSTTFGARVTTLDGVARTAEIVDVAPGRELALLRIEPFAGMVVASPMQIARVSSAVLSIGAPNNRPGTVTFGNVVDPQRAIRIQYGDYGFDDAIVLRMDVAPGHSGGPVFDNRGRLIGMIASFGLGDTRRAPYVPTGIAYAVPASAIARYLDELVPQPSAATRR